MTTIAVCTDSSSLLTGDEAVRLGVTVAPIAVTLDGEPFDEISAGVDRFYERFAAGALAMTAPPSPGELLARYVALADGGAGEVLSIHLDRRLSGTAASAELAGEESPVPVTVVDVETASFGLGLCVREAVRHLEAGASAGEAGAAARELAGLVRNAFVAPTGAGGRVPSRPSWAVLELAQGAVSVVGECATLDEAVGVMARMVESERPRRASVGHAAAAVGAAADTLAGTLERDQGLVVERYRVGAAVGAHTGGLSFGVFWWPADRT
ncbi:MAG TPA: DegV family protein [Gaiellaceae bacterium]|nr:DegV family protein [Gaiellaceae bacterium]